MKLEFIDINEQECDYRPNQKTSMIRRKMYRLDSI